MPTYEDPGVFCKLCCPPCAVYQAQGCACPQMLGSCCLGCVYTMFCWDATQGGAPTVTEMER